MVKPFRECVSVALFREDGKVLLVHKSRRRDAWQLPQGGMEKGESKEKAAKRELQEETGISLPKHHAVVESKEVYQYDYPPSYVRAVRSPYRGQHLTFIGSRAPHGISVHVDGRELDGYRWVSADELAKYIFRKPYLAVVRNVVKEFTRKRG
jgi:putative (di)nucleoside polyphosphate hydrolase